MRSHPEWLRRHVDKRPYQKYIARPIWNLENWNRLPVYGAVSRVISDSFMLYTFGGKR